MSSSTPNLNLVLPVGGEHVSRAIINENNTKIDMGFGTLSEQIVRSISANTDLNTLTEPGFYNTNNAITLTNAPVSGTNRLSLLVQKSENGYVFQQATENLQNSYGVYTRRCLNGTWTSWQQLETVEDVNSKMKNWETVFEDSTSITGLTVIGYKNSGLHLGLIRVVGGSTQTPSGRYSITFPSGFRLFNNYISVLKPLYITVAGASGYIDVSYSAVSINISADSTWTAGSIMFPIV